MQPIKWLATAQLELTGLILFKMNLKYFLAEISVRENLVFSILLKKKLFDNEGNEILLADSQSNYRCTLNPSSDIDSELSKISADGAELNPELINLIQNELKKTLEVWWTPERIESYKNSLNKGALPL